MLDNSGHCGTYYTWYKVVTYTEEHSSIVDEDIKAAILPLDFLLCSCDALFTVHIQGEKFWAETLPLQLPDCLLTTFPVAS